MKRGTPVAVWMGIARTNVGWWLVGAVLGAAVLAAEVWRRVKRGQRRQDGKTQAPGLEIRAVEDEGQQRLSRSPATVSSIGLVVHPDDGRQSVRLDGER